MKAPFAVLGIRAAGGTVTGIEYLPKTARGRPRVRREPLAIRRWLPAHEGYHCGA